MQEEIMEAKSVSQLRLKWQGGRISWEDGAKLNKKKKKIMSKCVTSEHCCEISNLIHEEVVVGWWSEDGLLQATFKKEPMVA